MATHPKTGETRVETVTAQIKGQGLKHLVKVTIDVDVKAGTKTARVTATDGHPFWAPELGAWVNATDLRSGEWLQTSAGTYVQITSVARWTALGATVHNLTVGDTHTYYVVAAATASVLVHNCDEPQADRASQDNNAEPSQADYDVHTTAVLDVDIPGVGITRPVAGNGEGGLTPAQLTALADDEFHTSPDLIPGRLHAEQRTILGAMLLGGRPLPRCLDAGPVRGGRLRRGPRSSNAYLQGVHRPARRNGFMGKESTRGGAGALASARTGDVVTITCPSREAVVADISAQYVSVRWPWNQIDPESVMQWNGLRAIPLAPDVRDWSNEPFQVTTPPHTLDRGRACEVGIPDAVAYVVHVAEFPEPLDVGWLPRPSTYVSLVSHGVKIFPDMEEVGFTLDPDGIEPIESQLIFRPYAFLEDGDEAADSEGRMWKYRAPWNWTPFDNGPGTFPVWPLHLVCRNGEENLDASANVAHATRSGAHGSEIARWLECAGLAEVPRLPPPVFGEDLPG